VWFVSLLIVYAELLQVDGASAREEIAAPHVAQVA